MGLDRHRGKGVKTAPPYTGWIAKADYEGQLMSRWGLLVVRPLDKR